MTKILANGKRKTIYRTLNWVRQHFEREYLQRLNKLLDSNGFVDIRNSRANPTTKIQNAILDFERNMFEKYVCLKPLGHLCINKNVQCTMPTMYILRLNYVCMYTGPEATTPFKKQWRIKSVEKDTYINKKATSLVVSTNDIIGLDDEDIFGKRKSHNKPYHPWLHIDEYLPMHPQCVGDAVPNRLMQEVDANHLIQIRDQRNLPDGDPNRKPDTLKFKLESTQHVFCTENPMSMPCYTLGERQVAGITYENDHYYGKLIKAADVDGRQKTYTEVLSKDWIARNTTEAFRELLHAKQNVFIWVPVGAPRPDSYPYNYDEELLLIVFPQEDRNTCETSSFASCLYCKLISDSDFQSQNWIKSLINFPAHIEQYGHEYIVNQSNDQSFAQCSEDIMNFQNSLR
jgi:hypothetical protein